MRNAAAAVLPPATLPGNIVMLNRRKRSVDAERVPLLYHGPRLAADTGREPDALFEPGRRGADRGWLAEGGPAEKQVTYCGISAVAGWLGTTPVVLLHRMARHPGIPCPAEDARLMPARSPAGYDRFWLPQRHPEFRQWWESLPAQGGPGQAKPRSGNRALAGPSVTVLAGTTALGEITAGFRWQAPVTVPNLKIQAAMDAAGGRLLVTGRGTSRIVYARTRQDADAAAQVIPALVFTEVSG